MRAFYEEHYRPDAMCLAVLGREGLDQLQAVSHRMVRSSLSRGERGKLRASVVVICKLLLLDSQARLLSIYGVRYEVSIFV